MLKECWLRLGPEGCSERIVMTTNLGRPRSHPEEFEPAAGEPPIPATDATLPESIGMKRLEALRCELDEGDNHWPDDMVAMIHEDYRQLMKDFGLR